MCMYGTAQETGLRDNQCDATAVYTAPDGTRAYALLDGIGSSAAVQEWTRAAARRLARAAARRGDAETGLRTVCDAYAAERTDPLTQDYAPKAAAVVAVLAPGKPMTVAWCGDSRAYLLTGGELRCLTSDHNMRRVIPPSGWHNGGNRNRITSCLGSTHTDEELMAEVGHPAIETATAPVQDARLLLASDGAYEPHEDGRHDLAALMASDPREAARNITRLAVSRSIAASRALDPNRPYADNATALVADIA
ncbi:PP2C family protein-serine/threonine phosphatase [Streptomyces zaomyceticus]|uniref:PP2C family protein-serine/threonine phosphatase n=1 Tax=Streptomyces zaomyceticus TaxID=68286 RepID=UPI0036470DCE